MSASYNHLCLLKFIFNITLLALLIYCFYIISGMLCKYKSATVQNSALLYASSRYIATSTKAIERHNEFQTSYASGGKYSVPLHSTLVSLTDNTISVETTQGQTILNTTTNGATYSPPTTNTTTTTTELIWSKEEVAVKLIPENMTKTFRRMKLNETALHPILALHFDLH